MKEKVNGMILVVDGSRLVRKNSVPRSADAKISKLVIEFADEEIHVIAISAGGLNAPTSGSKRRQPHMISQSRKTPERA